MRVKTKMSNPELISQQCPVNRLRGWTSLTYNARMVTREELGEILRKVNVEDVSKKSGVSTKTIYRLRQGSRHMPNLATVLRLLDAVKSSDKAAA